MEVQAEVLASAPALTGFIQGRRIYLQQGRDMMVVQDLELHLGVLAEVVVRAQRDKTEVQALTVLAMGVLAS
jgi:hypothetical protein